MSSAGSKEIEIVFGSIELGEELALIQSAEMHGISFKRVVSLGVKDRGYYGLVPRCLCRDGETVIFGSSVIQRYFSEIRNDNNKKIQAKSSSSTLLSSATETRAPLSLLSWIFKEACQRAFSEFDLQDQKIDVTPSTFASADYQCNSAMQIHTRLKSNPNYKCKTPQEAAKMILREVDATRFKWLASSFAISGNTFYINVVLSNEFLEKRMTELNEKGEMKRAKRMLASSNHQQPERVLIDFSSPNVAKEMHVGHLRSTIIGESLARLFDFMGYEVLRVNHLGDWGTQFGMLLEYLERYSAKNKVDTLKHLEDLSLKQLTMLYQQSKKAFDDKPDEFAEGYAIDVTNFKDAAKQKVVDLQSGRNPHSRLVWEKLVAVSRVGFESIYAKLDVSFDGKKEDGVGYCGESFYQKFIPDAIKELDEKKLTTKEEGAVLMFTGLDVAKTVDKDGGKGEIPLILQKSDGAYGYDSTDVAAVRYRLKTLNVSRVIYVTDIGQSLHFELVFECARLAKWLDSAKQRIDHVKFGVVTKGDGTKMKTRDGQTESLMDLLLDAQVAMKEVRAKREEEAKLAGMTLPVIEDPDAFFMKVGVSAVKFSDLNRSREKNYKFDRDAMMKTDSSSAIYPLYQYARMCGVIKKAPEVPDEFKYQIHGASEKERAIVLRLARFGEALEESIENLTPSTLCAFLHALCVDTASFYTDNAERILVNAAPNSNTLVFEPKRGIHRLVVVKCVKAVLCEGLRLLAIEPEERM